VVSKTLSALEQSMGVMAVEQDVMASLCFSNKPRALLTILTLARNLRPPAASIKLRHADSTTHPYLSTSHYSLHCFLLHTSDLDIDSTDCKSDIISTLRLHLIIPVRRRSVAPLWLFNTRDAGAKQSPTRK
jgi:hypothetical protein